MSQSEAEVGVVIRTKDRPVLLDRALVDVAGQTIGSWQVVVVNDGGDPAEVRAVVERRSALLGPRVSVVDAPRPGGRCAAANLGMRSLTAPYVVLHDDDDLWHPEFLATTLDRIREHPEEAGVMVPTEIVYEELRAGAYVETGRAPFWAGMTQISLLDLLTVNRAVPISFLYRRALHEEVGYYDETLETVEDWDFYLRVASRYPIGFTPGRPLAFWTQRPTALGRDANSMFALAAAHRRDDAVVRDRALRAYVAEYGLGLPLFLAALIRDASTEAEARRRNIAVESAKVALRSILKHVRSRLPFPRG